MQQQIALITLVVKEYDEAIRFYTERLGFILVEDSLQTSGKRWVVLAPPGSPGCRLLLAKAADAEQLSRVGNQAGGRVFLFLYTDDFHRDYTAFTERGVEFVRDPVQEPYGTVAVFKDLYGNRWDLLQPTR